MKKKILVTGSQGFIGTHLMKNIDAYGMDKKSGKNILTHPLPDADIVIHMAAQTKVIDSVSDPVNDAKVNILGTIRMAQRYKDSKFIFISSGGAIQEKIESPYGLSKFCAEEYVKMICKNYVILRFPNIYGPGSHSVVEKFINGPVRIFGDGTSTRDYVHVYDIVRAIKQAIGWKKGTYYLGSGKSIPVLKLAEATGKPIKFLPKVPGELQHSKVKNNTKWRPKIKVVEYVWEQCRINI